MTSPFRILLPVSAVAALALTGCAGQTPAADDGTITVVASTDVYGSIAEEIGAGRIEVTSIISGSAQDPHSYEASARDRLAVSNADVVVVNGGGYDSFMDQLVGTGDGGPEVIDVVELSDVAEDADDEHADEDHAETDEHADGDDHGHDHIEGVNEHVWFDVHVADEFAHELSSQLGELDPAGAAAYEAAYDDFSARLDVVHEGIHDLADRIGGASAAITEPVPLYLLEGAGLVNVTPDAFSEAIEEGTDVPPLALRDLLDTIAQGGVDVLAYNEQTASAETEQVRAAAESAGVPVVDFTETLPDGQDYVGWMTDNLDRLAAAFPA